ncbi:uncharacterized protein LOC118646222 [Monomorium pharaonis]|uniref:uncharacterized protein LOC118646222 n=1 Tax=Monomorium pharaonis TaxID=307658 RepID=UPI00063F886B|nr:uncharacterized protein LOC118646222 [Monomorium pharaonis]
MHCRGSYKEYLQNRRKIMPATTIYSRRQRELQGIAALNNQAENNAEENVEMQRLSAMKWQKLIIYMKILVMERLPQMILMLNMLTWQNLLNSQMIMVQNQ